MPIDRTRSGGPSLLNSIAENHSQHDFTNSHDHRSLSDSFRTARESSRSRDRSRSANGEGSRRSSSDELEMSMLSSGEEENDEETGLTGQERRELRRHRRRKQIDLDNRFAIASGTPSRIEAAVRASLSRTLITNAILIGLWYCFSLSISLYNKWMFSSDHLNFPFPLFTTCVHMLVQFSLACTVLYFVPRFRPGNSNLPSHGAHRIPEEDEYEKPSAQMTSKFYLTRIGPCGAATGMDIGFGNMSLKYISLSFYTMCKSSSLAFVLLFAFLFRLEQPSVKLILIIATMTIGVIMMVAGEIAFSAIGFLLVVSASFFSGFRWSLTQILLLRHPATNNPFSSIAFLAPVMFASLFLIAVPVEGLVALLHRFAELADHEGSSIIAAGVLLFPGLIAFLMTASEFALLQRTSVVTLSIAGIFKEVVTIGASALIFGDQLTPINLSGLMVTIGSIAAYNYVKLTKLKQETRKDVLFDDGGDESPQSTSAGLSGGGYNSIESLEVERRDPLGSVDGAWEQDGVMGASGFSRHRASASFSRGAPGALQHEGLGEEQKSRQGSGNGPLSSVGPNSGPGSAGLQPGNGKASPVFKDGNIKAS